MDQAELKSLLDQYNAHHAAPASLVLVHPAHKHVARDVLVSSSGSTVWGTLSQASVVLLGTYGSVWWEFVSLTKSWRAFLCEPPAGVAGGDMPVADSAPAPPFVSFEDAVLALLEVRHFDSVQDMVKALGRRGFRLARIQGQDS